jgi:hypothetical protein
MEATSIAAAELVGVAAIVVASRRSGGQQGNAKQKSVTPSETAATAAGICWDLWRWG